MEKISSEKQHQIMTESSIPKLVTKLAVPTVISMLITAVYNTADTYFVSQISKSATAAVSACFSIMSIIQAVGFGFGMGAGSLISINLGQKNNKNADRFASSAFAASVIIGALIGALPFIDLSAFLRFLGCSESMLPHAISYAKYILFIAPLYCATFVLNNTLRAEGHSRFSMWGLTSGGILNVILDPIFIFKLNMGTEGAAVATAISQTVSFLILLLFFIFKRSIVKISFKDISTRIKDYYQIVTMGLPTIFRQGLGSVSTTLLNIQAVVFGDEAVAAIALANKVYMIVRSVIIGIGQGYQPVAGYNYGAKKKERTKQAFFFAVSIGTLICVIATILIFIFPKNIIAFLSIDPDVITLGITAIKLASFVIPFMAFSTYVNQLFQCLGFKWQATFLASCRQGIFFIPLIFILPKFFNLTGIMICQSLSDVFTMLISIPFLIVFFKNHLKTE